jgi:Ser/Thr protein kinase RdoA (MazF antagonist)
MDEAPLGALLGRAVTSAVRYETAGISEVDLVRFADGRQAVVKRAPEEWHWTIDKELFVYGFAKKLTEHAELGGDVTLGKRIADHVAERAGLLDTCTTPSLCHNDCHEGNLIARDGHIAALVDFQNAVAGDPLLDLAKCAYYTRRDRGTVVRALAAGYGPLRARWRDALDLYVLYHQLELWGWFARIGTREPLGAIERELRAALS